ncbi:MAG: hypothetical protein FD177_2431 [Desulfovibrionaceae bacterium]|nr:MAG: hypothetical protein FD177_2431 [Desulfovibrionaceae bacterium]
MENRDDFKPSTKEALAQRAGYCCSFPGCHIPTSGPSNESSTATSNSGMACHISAAAPGRGARRYNPNITAEERASIQNGIWLCYRHGKIIDTDETRYTVEQLKKWKELAELRAHLTQTYGTNINFQEYFFNTTELPNYSTDISGSDIDNDLISDAIEDSCMSQIWGKHTSNAVCDAVIEFSRNAFQHGNASYFRLTIEPNKVILIDDGKDFNPWHFVNLEDKTGGILAFKELIKLHANNFIFIASRSDNNNVYAIIHLKNANEIPLLTPCAIEVKRENLKDPQILFKALETCKAIYILFQRQLCISDGRLFADMIKLQSYENRQLIFIAKASETTFRVLLDAHPGSQYISL